jgi:hypothetical protein
MLIKELIREKRERLAEGKFLAKITGVTKVLALCRKVDKIIHYHHLQGERPTVNRKKAISLRTKSGGTVLHFAPWQGP